MRSQILFGIFISIVSISSEKARFDNYRVYRVWIENPEHFEIVQELENTQDGLIFFETPNPLKKTAEIIVPPHKIADINEFFENYKLKAEIKVFDLQRLIDQEQPEFGSRATFDWKHYHSLSAIYNWLDQLLKEYPNILTNYNFGTSYENRTLRAVKISHKADNPTIFIESTIHAREWVTAATATYILNELLTSTDPEVKRLAENYNWVFVPVINVDGYAYTHSYNRLWRKTRQPHPILKLCIGADPNRNWDFHHAEVGSSKNPCSDIYAGPKPFSEPEILALSEFVKTVENLKLYISFHSYSQLLLFPYGFSNEHAANHDDMKQIGSKAKEAIEKRFKTQYVVGNIAETIYLASGSSIDWVYATQNVSLTYTFEFRDTGKHGFLLPTDQIIPNSLEILDGLKALVEEARKLNYF